MTVKDTVYNATVIPIVFDSVIVGNTIITNSSTSTATLADEVRNFSAEKSDGTTYSIDADGKFELIIAVAIRIKSFRNRLISFFVSKGFR